MAVKLERIKGLTQGGLVSDVELFCNRIGEDKIISVSFAADSNSIGRNKYAIVTYIV